MENLNPGKYRVESFIFYPSGDERGQFLDIKPGTATIIDGRQVKLEDFIPSELDPMGDHGINGTWLLNVNASIQLHGNIHVYSGRKLLSLLGLRRIRC